MKKQKSGLHFISLLLLLVLLCALHIPALAASGWTAENGALYYYTRSGQPLTGEQTVDDVLYSFLPDGRLTGQNLCVTTPMGTYCINGTSFVTGFMANGDVLQHFGSDGLRTENGTAEGLTVQNGTVCGNGIYVRNGTVRYYLENDRIAFRVSDYEAQLVLTADEAEQGGQAAVTLSVSNNPGIAQLAVSLTWDKDELALSYLYDNAVLYGFEKTDTENGVVLTWENTENSRKDGILATLYFTASDATGEHTIKAQATAADAAGTDKSVKPAGANVLVTCKHEFGEYIYNEDATCTLDGTKTAVCSKCKQSRTVTAAGTMLPHSGGDATCVTRAVCAVCNTVYGSYDTSDHRNLTAQPGEEPTCYKNGFTAHQSCMDCNAVVGKELLPALNHKNAQAVPLLLPTCTEDGHSQYTLCPDCGLENGKEVFPATGHLHTVTVAALAPTCTEEGWEAYTFCNDCRTALDKTVLPATDHKNKEFMPGTPATCSEEGFSDYYYCPDCDTALGYSVLAAIAHRNSRTVEEIPATCTADGCSEHVLCPDCGMTIGKTVYPATGHNNIQPVAAYAATCSEDGCNAHTVCIDCGTAFDKIVYPATGHQSIVTVLAVPATCTTEGCNDHTRCMDCNTDFDKITYPPLNHANTVAVEEKQPTCTEDGHCAHLLCTDCGRAFGKTVYPKLDHPGGFMVPEQPATCSADGVTAYFYCPLCKAEEGKQILPALRHKNATRYNEVPATCDEDGMSAYLDCPDCGLTIGKQVLPRLNHKNMYTVPEKAGTCLEQGHTSYLYCPDCELTVGKQPTPKTDHLYTNWAVFEAPMLGIKGKEFRLCMVCAHTQYNDLPALTLSDGSLVNRGDTDGNGKTDAADARLALRLAVGLEEKTAQREMLADFDGDGKISAADARQILRVSVGLDKDENTKRFFITPDGHIEEFILSDTQQNT